MLTRPRTPRSCGEKVAQVYREYDRRLRESNGLDFDDLIAKTIELLETERDVCTRYQNKFRYILVDEYQDVNYAQYKLCAILAGEHKNLTVVGDDDQSIYSWRGSDYKNILRFEHDFPGTAVFKLEENFRSTQTILSIANEIVANNASRAAKTIFTKRAARRSRDRVRRRDRARRGALRHRKDQRTRARRRGLPGFRRPVSDQRAVAGLRRRRSLARASRTASSAASASMRGPRSKT